MSGKHSILVVEDDDGYREILVQILKSSGFEVDSASGGKLASEKLQAKEYDMVLSDIRMPEGSGVELLVWLRNRNPKLPPMILMTGYTVQDLEELKTKGASAVLEKPFQRSTLIDAIKKALAE